MRIKGNLQPPAKVIIISFLHLALFIIATSGFTFSSALVGVDNPQINAVATYTVTLSRSYDDSLNPTPWDSAVIQTTATATLHFPSQFSKSQLDIFSCISIMVNQNPVSGYTCTLSNTTIIVSNLFSGSDMVSEVDIVISGIVNPSSAVTTSAFIGTIDTDTSNDSPTAEVTFTPKTLSNLAISFKGGIVNRTSDMVISLTTVDPIPENGLITIQFPPTLLWARQVSTSHLIPINGMLSCYGLTPQINNATIQCSGMYSTQIVTVSSLFASSLPANKVITIGIQGIFAPPTTEEADSLTVTTCDSSANSIDAQTTTISGLVAQTLSPYSMQSSLVTAMGVNNYLGGLTFSFTLTDTITLKDYFVVTFPTGTSITSTQNASTIKLQSVTYNPTSLALTMLQNSTNPNNYAGTVVTITFIRFKAPPSIKPSSPITFTILNNGFSKMIASATITAVANNYTLSAVATSKVVNVFTSYNFSFTMSDALTTTGYFVLILDPQLCARTAQKNSITTNLSVSISGTSINSAPSTQISTTTSNGSSTYQLLLSNLNASSTSIPTQTITITVNNILNPSAVTSLTSFSLSTYYSNSADLVANALYSSSIKLQTGPITLTSVTSTSSTTYTFTILSVNFQNTNPVPANGYILLSIPTDITLLSASSSYIQVSGSFVSSTFTNTLSNNTIILQISAAIAAASSISISINNIMTQNSTKPTSTFTVSSFDSSFNAIDQSTNSVGLTISSGNNFNSLTLSRIDSTNSKTTNYTITFEQIQNYTYASVVAFTFSSTLSTSSLSRVYEVTSNGAVYTACLFSKINSSYLLVTLSQSATSTHTLILQTIGNPPSQAPLNSPILVSTLTSNYTYIYSQMYVQDIINTNPSSLIINSYSFSSQIYSMPTNLSLSVTGLSLWPTLTAQLIINVPPAIGLNGATCSSSSTNLICSFFAPTNVIVVSMSDSSSLPLDIIFVVDSLIAPAYGSSSQTFELTTYDAGAYQIQHDNSTVIFSNNCSLSCRTCSNTNSSACLTCYSSQTTNKTLLYDQTCVSSCPSNSYQQNVTCIACIASCLTCSNSSDNCSSCSFNSTSAYYYYNITSASGNCLSSCSSGTYSLNFTCLDCLSTCASCNSTSFCFHCQPGYYYYNGTCLLLCPNNTLTNTTNSSCTTCQSPCFSCFNTISNCSSCISGTVFYNNSCSATCPAANLYISANQTCDPCGSVCATCSIIASNCTSCNLALNSSHFYNSTCLSSCPDLYYSNVSTAICLACNSLGIGCSNCSSSTTCIACDSGFLYFPSNQSCLNSTPTGYFNINGTLYTCNSSCNSCVNSSSSCTSCSGNLSLYQSQCISSCPLNQTVSVNNTCSSCSYPCSTCFNSTSTCLSCAVNSSLYYDSTSHACVNSTGCPNSSFSDNSSYICSTCNASCVLCSGTSANCSKCSSSYYLIGQTNTCSTTCPNGTVQVNLTSGNICQACAYPCLTCSGSINYCLSCSQANSSLFLNSNGSCVSNSSCSSGTYANSTSYQCQICVSPCSTCETANICSTCQANYSLIASNFTCTTNCPAKEAPSIINGSSICTACTFPCNTCSLSISNCTSCASNSSLYLQGNLCVNASGCSVGTYANESDNTCSACLSSCANCISLQNCSSCSVNYYLDRATNLCVTANSCQNGTVSGYNSTSGKNQCLSCSSPCQTCSNTTTKCSSCAQTNSTLFLLNSSCVNASICPSGTFADLITYTCLGCISPCNACSNYSICISCVQDYFLNGTQCLGLCPNGTYVLNQSGIITCMGCNSSCETCSFNASKCTSCFNSSYLFNDSCLNSSSCPSGTYADSNSNICTNCSSPCVTCSSQAVCMSCISNNSVLLQNGSCYSTCPNGTISISISGIKTCVSCSSQCSTCISNVSSCTTCSNSTQYLYNGSCYDSTLCPNGTFPNSVNNTCQVCNSTCNLCSNNTYCLSCAANYYLSNSICISACPNGTLGVNSSNSGVCQTCQSPCSTCSNSLTNCTSCLFTNTTSFYYYNNTCFNSSQCPSSTYQNNLTLKCEICTLPCGNCQSSAICLTCISGYYLDFNHSCLASCPNGTLALNTTSGGVCQACTYPCSVCLGSLTFCLACSQANETLYLLNGSCVSSTSCSNGTYANSTSFQCQTCVPACSTCSAFSACTTCSSGYYLNGSSCSTTCPNGTLNQTSSSGGICQACSYPCNYCALSLTNCLSCSQVNSTLYLANGSCVSSSSCSNGTYANITSLKCQTCVSSCTSCTAYSTCQNCSQNYYYNNQSCHSTCPNGTLAQNSTSGGICQTCTYPCATCANSLVNCTGCSQDNSTLYLSSGNCVASSSCTNGTYPNSTTLKCQTCVLACSSCASNAVCTTCNSGFYLMNSSCLSTCPNGTVGDNSNNTCVNCLSPCNYCTFNQTVCTSCLSPFLYYSINNSCLTGCPNGYYASISTLKCLVCISPCNFCASSTSCLSCASNYYLYNSSCLNNCPGGFYNDISNGNGVCSLCTNNCSTCSNINTCTSCSAPYLYYNGLCGTSCPSSASYNASNNCSTCSQAINGCASCSNVSTTIAFCVQCSSSLTLVQGNCVNTQSNNDNALSSSLTSATIFPLPFTITGSIIFIACFMSKLQNKNSYVVGTAYSLFGFIESACLIYTIIVYHLYVVANSPALDYQIYLQAALLVIAALNIFGLIVQTYQLHNDQKFGRWTRSKCNYCCYIIVAILSCLFNYKFKMLIFTKLFSFYCLRAQLESVQKFRVFNVMSFLGVGHEGLVIYIAAIIMAALPPHQQMFLSFLDLVLVNVLNIGLALAVSSKEESFFEEHEEDGLKINKVVNLYDESYEANPVEDEDEKKGKFKEKGGLESRDMMLDDDDEFTLSISDRQSSNISDDKIAPENASMLRKNKSAIMDSESSHDHEHEHETGNSLKRNAKGSLNIVSSNVSAVYQGDLSRSKRKKFEQAHQVSKEIIEKSKHSAISERQNEQISEKDIHKQENIFDVGGEIEEEDANQDLLNQNNRAIVSNQKIQTVLIHPQNYAEDHQFAQFQTGVENPPQIFVKENKQIESNENEEISQVQNSTGLNQQQSQKVSAQQISLNKEDTSANLHPSASSASMIPPAVRQIKVYRGRQNQNEDHDEDIQEIDLTISKKQRELIELRKSIRKKQRERQRSQQRKSRKNRSNSKDKRSRDAMSEIGMPPQKSRELSSRGTLDQPNSVRLQVIQRQMESSKLQVDEQLIAPVTYSPNSKKPRTQNYVINEQIAQSKLMQSKLPANNTIEQQPIQSSIAVEEADEINLQQLKPQPQPIVEQLNNRSSPSKILSRGNVINKSVNSINNLSNQQGNYSNLLDNPTEMLDKSDKSALSNLKKAANNQTTTKNANDSSKPSTHQVGSVNNTSLHQSNWFNPINQQGNSSNNLNNLSNNLSNPSNTPNHPSSNLNNPSNNPNKPSSNPNNSSSTPNNQTKTTSDNPLAPNSNKMKVQFQQIDRQYDNKYYISPRDEQTYQIQEMDYEFKDPDSVQNRSKPPQQNIFQYKKEEHSFISEQPSQAEKHKLIGFISKPHKKVDPDYENDIIENQNQLQFKIAPDSENNPLENKIKQIGKQGMLSSKSFNDNGDALEEMVDRTSRNQINKNRSHLMRKSNEEPEQRQHSLQRKNNNFTQEMRAMPTQQSHLYQELNDASTIREASDKEFTERKFTMNRPPMQHQRPATTEKNRMYVTGLKQMQGQQPSYAHRGEESSLRNEPMAARTSYDMSFKGFKSKEFDKDGENKFEMYPSSFSSNQIRLDSEELAREPNKPHVSRTARIKQAQGEEQREQERSLNDSFARRSMKSYKSRSIDREDYDQQQQLQNQQTLSNSRKKSIDRGESSNNNNNNNNDLSEYYKRSKDSPSNRSNKSRSRSKSRQGNRSDLRTKQLEKIYLQRLEFKK